MPAVKKLQFGDVDALKRAAKATPIERMYLSFGRKVRKHCDTCVHHGGWMDNRCSLYSWLTGDNALIDWNEKACGKWEPEADTSSSAGGTHA